MTAEQLGLLLNYIDIKMYVEIGYATNQPRSKDSIDRLMDIVRELRESTKPAPCT